MNVNQTGLKQQLKGLNILFTVQEFKSLYIFMQRIKEMLYKTLLQSQLQQSGNDLVKSSCKKTQKNSNKMQAFTLKNI